MRPGDGEVLHFSEDPHITRFVPHVAATAQQPDAYVWAVNAFHAPSYWFPRQCPRAMTWRGPSTTGEDAMAILGPGTHSRVHAIEYEWLDALRTTQLYAYPFSAADFRPFSPAESHAFVCEREVEPLGPPRVVGNLLDLHREADIQLRLVDNLWPFWDVVIESTMGFSGIRLRNAKPRP